MLLAVRQLIVEHPEVGLRIMAVLERRLCLYGEWMLDISNRDVTIRLARLILYLVEDEGVVDREGIRLEHHYSHAELATVVGCKRVAATRAFRELRHRGLELHNHYIRVKDMTCLEQAAVP
jgi:CRP/FNR family transcriptional regulator, cyclic AMP receptor protein